MEIDDRRFKILMFFVFLFIANIFISARLTAAQESSSIYTTAFDYRWLLPFLAIPLAFFLLQILGNDEVNDNDLYMTPRRTQKALVGTKGGKAKKKKNEKKSKERKRKTSKDK